MTWVPECRQCGRDHLAFGGAAAIYCDWVRGHESPSTTVAHQERIGRQFAADHPVEADAIARGHAPARLARRRRPRARR